MFANIVIINAIIIIIITTVLGISMETMNGLTTGMKNTECSVASVYASRVLRLHVFKRERGSYHWHRDPKVGLKFLPNI